MNLATVFKGIGKAANTKYGRIALATGAGMLLARHLTNRYINSSSEDEETKDKTAPKKRKFDWQKRSKLTESLLERNYNLPSQVTTPFKIGKNPRSLAATVGKSQMNKYKTTAERNFLEIQRKIGRSSMKKTKADTGYDSRMGKLVA
jgi:hypothetical protein